MCSSSVHIHTAVPVVWSSFDQAALRDIRQLDSKRCLVQVRCHSSNNSLCSHKTMRMLRVMDCPMDSLWDRRAVPFRIELDQLPILSTEVTGGGRSARQASKSRLHLHQLPPARPHAARPYGALISFARRPSVPGWRANGVEETGRFVWKSDAESMPSCSKRWVPCTPDFARRDLAPLRVPSREILGPPVFPRDATPRLPRRSRYFSWKTKRLSQVATAIWVLMLSSLLLLLSSSLLLSSLLSSLL